jgi:hypothetical protein
MKIGSIENVGMIKVILNASPTNRAKKLGDTEEWRWLRENGDFTSPSGDEVIIHVSREGDAPKMLQPAFREAEKQQARWVLFQLGGDV